MYVERESSLIMVAASQNRQLLLRSDERVSKDDK